MCWHYREPSFTNIVPILLEVFYLFRFFGGFFGGIFFLFFFLMWDDKQLKKCSINANLKRELHDFLKGEEGHLNIF